MCKERKNCKLIDVEDFLYHCQCGVKGTICCEKAVCKKHNLKLDDENTVVSVLKRVLKWTPTGTTGFDYPRKFNQEYTSID